MGPRGPEGVDGFVGAPGEPGEGGINSPGVKGERGEDGYPGNRVSDIVLVSGTYYMQQQRFLLAGTSWGSSTAAWEKRPKGRAGHVWSSWFQGTARSPR